MQRMVRCLVRATMFKTRFPWWNSRVYQKEQRKNRRLSKIAWWTSETNCFYSSKRPKWYHWKEWLLCCLYFFTATQGRICCGPHWQRAAQAYLVLLEVCKTPKGFFRSCRHWRSQCHLFGGCIMVDEWWPLVHDLSGPPREILRGIRRLIPGTLSFWDPGGKLYKRSKQKVLYNFDLVVSSVENL